MAKCKDYQNGGKTCKNFYKCQEPNETVQVGTSIKRLQQHCFYCMGTPGVKKIADVPSFTGNTPKWCPLGRDAK